VIGETLLADLVSVSNRSSISREHQWLGHLGRDGLKLPRSTSRLVCPGWDNDLSSTMYVPKREGVRKLAWTKGGGHGRADLHCLGWSVSPSSADPMLLPDLGMARGSTVTVDTGTFPGRRLLRYESTLVNVGARPFELTGLRADRSPSRHDDSRTYDFPARLRRLWRVHRRFDLGNNHVMVLGTRQYRSLRNLGKDCCTTLRIRKNRVNILAAGARC
jgi:hypothetical protein